MNEDRIILAHGSGGKRMDALIRNVFLDRFGYGNSDFLTDSFIFSGNGNQQMAFTTDSFVVDPLFFAGGDIGKIAVSGTVNDLSVSGARPMFLSASFIIEEGFSMIELTKIAESMAEEAKKAGIRIVTGDTKVVQKGKADKLFINTAGIGVLPNNLAHIPNGSTIEPGDILIINGNLGEHAVAVMCERENISFEEPVCSDVAPLNGLIENVLNHTSKVSFMRDVTRGGLGSVAKEIAERKPYGIRLIEDKIPVSPLVQSYCEIFGYEPLYLANEGKVLMIVKPAEAEKAVKIMKEHPLGKNAAVIGEITDKHPGKVFLQTTYKGNRVIDKLSGEQLPRIC